MDRGFRLISSFKPSGDQPFAIEKLVQGIKEGKKHQVLLGVTGSGKTFTIANLIEKIQKPALVISPNKILAAQLYAEFKSFFPYNAVEYFISYYDYYQPEAYIPQTDTYIEKDSSINEHIDKMRLKATSSLFERRDVIVVASVSCIYNLGSPNEYLDQCVIIKKGLNISQSDIINALISVNYERNDIDFSRGKFRVRGDILDIFPAYLDTAIRVEFNGRIIENIKEINPITGDVLSQKVVVYIYPARHFVTSKDLLEQALKNIEEEMIICVNEFKSKGKFLEAQRLEQRTRYDIEMIRETGFCHGIENYSRHLSNRLPGSRPPCLIDYFYASNFIKETGFVVVIDESHITVPQIRGMYEGDRSRKQTLIDFGFRLPSALDNRPLKFDEFENLVPQVVYVSATPGPYELKKSSKEVIELIIRPTGLVDPEVIIKPTKNQIKDLIKEINVCVSKKERVLVTTLTKRMAEDLCRYLQEQGLKVEYLHSEIDALKRFEILKNLRLGKFDTLIGINLLREGLDLPEVSLVAVLDADKEGFLRSETSLIQVCGRAARNINGKVILYADNITGSIERALQEMNRRRTKQLEYNKINKITPRSIIKAVHDLEEFQYKAKEKALTEVVKESGIDYVSPKNIKLVMKELEKQMKDAADNLDFELATIIRDKLFALREMNLLKSKDKDKSNKHFKYK